MHTLYFRTREYVARYSVFMRWYATCSKHCSVGLVIPKNSPSGRRCGSLSAVDSMQGYRWSPSAILGAPGPPTTWLSPKYYRSCLPRPVVLQLILTTCQGVPWTPWGPSAPQACLSPVAVGIASPFLYARPKWNVAPLVEKKCPAKATNKYLQRA